MKSPVSRPSNVPMKARYLYFLTLLACSSSTTVVYQMIPEEAGVHADAGSTADSSVFAQDAPSDEDSATFDANEQPETSVDAGDASDTSFDASYVETSIDAEAGH